MIRSGLVCLLATWACLACGQAAEAVQEEDSSRVASVGALPPVRRFTQSRVLRGPYLQSGSSTSMVVRWRTDQPVLGAVYYGTNSFRPALRTFANGLNTEHVVRLPDLKPATRYYYWIGTDELILAGDKESFSFQTAPESGATQPMRIWVLGDPGTGLVKQRLVRDAYYKVTGKKHTDFWLMLGDNAYSYGMDDEFQKYLFQTYPQTLRQSVLWPTLGNHDGYSANSSTQSGVYYDIFSLPTQGQSGGVLSGTEAYYSFDYGNVHVICLDSHDSNRSRTGPMATWLQEDLAASRLTWNIAFFHHPPYSRGGHHSDGEFTGEVRLKEMRENILPLLEEGGVDLVLNGHSHSYERSFLVDGHYGESETLTPAMIKNKTLGREETGGVYRKESVGKVPHSGTVYVVCGSSGQLSGGPLDHPVMALSTNLCGSLILEVEGLRLKTSFLSDEGKVVDHFTMQKGR